MTCQQLKLFGAAITLIIFAVMAVLCWAIPSHAPTHGNVTTGEIDGNRAVLETKEVPQVPSQPSRCSRAIVMEATAYCYGNVTATGTKPIPGRTVAADPSVLPYGTELVIDGQSGYVVEDCGNYWSDKRSHTGYYEHIRGNRIDIFVEDYQTAIAFGRREVTVEIVSKGGTP